MLNTVENTKDEWAHEGFTGGSMEQGALANAYALGGVTALYGAIDIIRNGEKT